MTDRGERREAYVESKIAIAREKKRNGWGEGKGGERWER
jgi:hypothetical protein